MDHDDPAIVANAVICLIHQANYLLDQQIAALEREFISEGGYSEQLAAARLAERGKQQGTGLPAKDAPACPTCGKAMALRTARQRSTRGRAVLGLHGLPGVQGNAGVQRVSRI